MEKVLEYLELKNQYYKKFHEITSRFIQKVNGNCWDDLEFLVDNRERILKIIRSFDLKIANLLQEPNVKEDTLANYGDKVRDLLAQRKALADQIVVTDLDLISRMDVLKSETIKELRKVVDTKTKIDSFQGIASPNQRKRRVA